MSKPRLIEKAKTLSLVVLFLSTVLLLYFFWGNISTGELYAPPAQAAGKLPEAASLIKPNQIVVNFGGDNYTVMMPADIWRDSPVGDSFVAELDRFSAAENVLVKEIPADKYQQVMKLKSIFAEFNYNIPTSDFCAVFGMDNPQNYSAIGAVTAIGYSTAQDGKSLFVYDGEAKKYYWLQADAGDGEDSGFSGLIDSIEAQGYSNNIYYPASAILGVENNTLVPLSVKSALKSVPFKQDSYSHQTDKINALAAPFFGGNFDFVRSIVEENGTVIYMYGYGQNVLIVSPDGTIEYKEEQTGQNGGQSFTSALETAVNYVASHGSWTPLEKEGLTPYLKGVIPNPNKKQGYRFIFGMELNGNRIYYEDGEPLVADVTSGQVTYYKSQIIDFDSGDIEAVETGSSGAGDSDDAYSAANLIAGNYQYIYNVLQQSGGVIPAKNQVTVEDVAVLISDMQTGYVKPAGNGITELRPAWIVTAADIDIYFDLYSADPIGFSKE